MTILKKIAQTLVVTPGIAGSAGTPPTPGYWQTTTQVVPVESTVYVFGIKNPDGTYSQAQFGDPGAVLLGTFTTRTYKSVTTTTWVPPTPGTAPVAYQPAQTVDQYQLGWDGGARSIAPLVGDGALRFSVPAQAVGAVVGLSPLSGGTFSRERASHGLYFRHGLVSVMEAGQEVSAASAYVDADVFRITRAGSMVRYWRNTTLLHTSLAPSYGDQYAVASLYSGADTVTSAEFSTAAADNPITGSGTATLRPFAARGGQGTGQGTGMATLRPYSASATGQRPNGGRMTLQPFAARGGKASGAGSAVLQPLTARGQATSDGPTYALGTANLALITSFGTGQLPAASLSPSTSLGDAAAVWSVGQWDGLTVHIVSGTGAGQSRTIATNTAQALLLAAAWTTVPDGTSGYEIRAGDGTVLHAGTVAAPGNQLRPYAALAAARPYGGGAARLQPLASVGYQLQPVNNWAVVSAPSFQLQASATVIEPARFAGRMPSPQLQAFTGAHAALTVPRFQLQASATVTTLARAELTVPRFALQASGTLGVAARAELTAPGGYTLLAFTGAQVVGELPGFGLQAQATTGTSARATLALPLFQLEASATQGIRASAELTMPMLRAATSGRAELTAPRFVLQAVGQVLLEVQREAYAVLLSGDDRAVTRYEGLPFEQVVRYQGRYYGVGPAGLALLEGDTDGGAPIGYAVRTAASDFGTSHKKNLGEAVFGGRFGPGASISLLAGEKPQNLVAYAMPNDRGAEAQNHRQRFGKGFAERYYALELADPAGGPLELESIDITVTQLKRKV